MLTYTGLYFDRYNATIQRRCYILSHNRLCYQKTLHRCDKRIQRWVSSHLCSSRRVPFVQPSATLYCYLTLTQCQEICSVFISDDSDLHIYLQFSKRGVIYLFHSRKIHISSKGKLDMSVISSLLFRFFVWWHKYFITWFYIHTFYCIYI